MTEVLVLTRRIYDLLPDPIAKATFDVMRRKGEAVLIEEEKRTEEET